jgi:hypothetical protein
MKEDQNQPARTPLPEDSPGENPLQPITPLNEYYQPPRLGIIHLLAWVTVAAVLMKLNLALEVLPSGSSNLNLSETLLLAGKLQQAARAIVTAALLVGGFVFWLDRYHRKPGYLQPGHWIVGIDGLLELESLIFSTIFLLGIAKINQVQMSMSTVMMAFAIFNMLIRISAFFFAAWRLPERWRWKWVLGIEAFSVVLVLSVLSVFFVSRNAIPVGVIRFCFSYFDFPLASIIVIAIVIDLAKGLRRDWLHWLGAVYPLVLFAMKIASQLISFYFLPILK